MAAEHGKTPAQVALKWLLQKDMIVIPKASSTSHLRDNLDLFDWQLGDEEMARPRRSGDRSRLGLVGATGRSPLPMRNVSQ